MSVLWTSQDAALATGGQTTSTWVAHGVSIDTRTLEYGDLFVALTAARDGHDFVEAALEKGAAAALVSRVPDGMEDTARLLIVDDVQKALEALGRAARARTAAQVIAVTGSVGKTSTKDMLHHVLAAQGRVHAAERSYNNHWGVPLTLARMPADAEFAVIEIGMNAPGEIAPLSKFARPNVAVITTVAPAHLEAFETIEGIAREKAAIFEGLEPEGVAIINGDLDVSPLLASQAEVRAAQVVTFGTGSENHHRATDLRVQETTTVGTARLWRTNVAYCVRAPGKHFAVNALAVLAATHAVGADRARAIMSLASWSPRDGRGTHERIGLDPVDDAISFDLIDDAFNANPASMGASLDVLATTKPRDHVGRIAQGRRIAVLGDMLELGKTEADLHADLAAHPALDAVTTVHCVGPLMHGLWRLLPEGQRGIWTEDAEKMQARAHQIVDAGDVVLVKGSKGSRVSLVVDAIRKLGHRVHRNDQGAS